MFFLPLPIQQLDILKPTKLIWGGSVSSLKWPHTSMAKDWIICDLKISMSRDQSILVLRKKVSRHTERIYKRMPISALRELGLSKAKYLVDIQATKGMRVYGFVKV